MLNKVMLIGNLGADPELRYTGSGVPVATFSLATNRKWKDADGNAHEKTEWHHIVVWKSLGELCDKYLSKGKKAYVEGRLQTRKWIDQNGSDRYTTEIIASSVIFLSPSNSSSDPIHSPAPPSSEYEESGGMGTDDPF